MPYEFLVILKLSYTQWETHISGKYEILLHNFQEQLSYHSGQKTFNCLVLVNSFQYDLIMQLQKKVYVLMFGQWTNVSVV